MVYEVQFKNLISWKSHVRYESHLRYSIFNFKPINLDNRDVMLILAWNVKYMNVFFKS